MDKTVTVHKFGGSCLRDMSDLNRISEVIQHWSGQSLLVVSALWGTTDRLMRASKEPRYASRLVNDLSRQHLRFAPGLVEGPNGEVFKTVLQGIEQSLVELARSPKNWIATNRLLAAGERLSALVVAHHLQKSGIDAHPVGAEDIGLKLDGSNRAPTVDIHASMEVIDRSALVGTPVITGWFGEGADGELALLGRGGSDHTATSIGRLVNADKVVLWKDVDGVMPLNPRWGIEGLPIPYLGYGEAMELARLDTPVLHPATVEPLREVGIPLEIRDLRGRLKDTASTVIGPDLHHSPHVKAVGCLPSVARLSIRTSSLEMQTKQLGRVLLDFAEAEIPCWNVTSQPRDISWIISQHDLPRALELVTMHFEAPQISMYGALVSLVGNKLPHPSTSLISEQMIEELEIELLSNTDHAIRMLSSTNDVQNLLKTLSDELNLRVQN
jgi:aspartate kinase